MMVSEFAAMTATERAGWYIGTNGRAQARWTTTEMWATVYVRGEAQKTHTDAQSFGPFNHQTHPARW